MKTRFLSLLCAALLLASHAFAADDGTDLSTTVLKDFQHFVVQRDGSYVETTEDLVQLNEQRAIAGSAQRAFHFNRTHEDVEVLEAYNEKPDGRRIPVTPEQVKLQQEPAYSGAPMFQDMQVKTLIYSDVAVGDKLYSKVRRTRRVALFEGQFSDTTMPRFRPTRQLTLVYDLPSTMPLKADAVGFAPTAPVEKDGRTVYRWDYVQAENPRIEAGTVNYWDYGRHLIVSTFEDYAAVGLAYDRAAAKAAVPGEHVTAKARALVQGIVDPRARAYAIENWVRRNVRYVAVYIGNGGVVPHSAESVLDNLYGDCKDHTTLMEAMLRAVGIDSTPVLINAGNSYKLAQVASLGQFNHAITYVPALDLYLDSTAESVAAGYLPDYELDKQVILTRSGKLGHTPITQAGKVSNHYVLHLAADGSAAFEFTRDQGGWIAEGVRHQHRNWRKNDRDRFVEALLKGFGAKGGGDVELGDLSDAAANQDYRYALRGKGDEWFNLPGTIGVPAMSSLYLSLGQQVLALTSEATRTQPFMCPVNDAEEEAVYELPRGATLLVVPPDVHVKSPYFDYSAQYKRGAGKLTIVRRYRSGKDGTRVCLPEDYVAMQADIRRMVRDLRSQFILQVPEPAEAAQSVAAAVAGH